MAEPEVPQGGWFGTVLDAMRIDPAYRPDCEWNVYEPKYAGGRERDDAEDRCTKPATWLFRFEHGFVTVRCDEHVDSLPNIVNKLLSAGRGPVARCPGPQGWSRVPDFASLARERRSSAALA